MVEAWEKKLSRAEARSLRKFIMARAGNSCEVCGLGVGPLLRVHHIVTVGDGGIGKPTNLIGLCPLCHETVHYFNRRHVSYQLDTDKLFSSKTFWRLIDVAQRKVQFNSDGSKIIFPADERKDKV